MKTISSHSAMPIPDHKTQDVYKGLTKREYFAAQMNDYLLGILWDDEISKKIHSLAKGVGITELEVNSYTKYDTLKLILRIDARLKVMQADALIDALNEIPE